VARLFGRQLDQVLAQRLLLQGDGRLATLTGMGGIGKTALARAVARWAWRRNLFPGGVYFASLENLAAGETAAARLAAKLDLTPGQGQTPEDALAAALGRPLPALLAADNCETAAGAGLEVLTALRRRCPRLRVLATGRRPLSLEGESLYRLPPLALNDAARAHRLTAAGRPDLPARQRRHVLERWEADGRSRYGMLATTAEFGRARAAGPEADLALPALRRRHAEHYLAVASRFDETPMEEWWALEPDMDNVVAGFETAVAEMEAALGTPLKDLVADWESLLERQKEEDEANLAGEYSLALKDYVFRRRPPQSERWLGAGLVAWTAAGHQRRVGLFCNELGVIHKARGDYAAALEWYQKSVALKEELGDKAGLATSFNNIASVHYARGDYAAALEWYQKSVALKEELGNKAGLARSYGNIAKLHLAQGEHGQAEHLFNQALQTFEDIGDKSGIATTYNELGRISHARGDYAAALEWYQKSVALQEQLGDKAGLATSFNNIASVHYARGNYAAALDWYQKSVALQEELGDKAGLAASFNNIGLIYDARGDYAAALEWYQKSVALQEELEFQQHRRRLPGAG